MPAEWREMEEEMEDTIEFTFTVVEVDLDYEFDAARYFDFSREESVAEARESEVWFESAGSYPPSPFVANLVPRENILLGNFGMGIKPKGDEDMSLIDSMCDTEGEPDSSVMDVNYRGSERMGGDIHANLQRSTQRKPDNYSHQLPSGLTFHCHMNKDNSQAKIKSSVKPSFPRTSTLMKPTASQLAKQNRPHQLGDFRLQKLVENNDKISNNPSGVEIQAAKRQKLEGGHLHKVGHTKQQMNFIHKEPERDGVIHTNLLHAKVRLTVPREPDLETAHRAHRMRQKTGTTVEDVTSAIRKFKARPLNRKILEAPSLLLPKRSTPRLPEFQEFHLKTSDRAMQHASEVSSSSVTCTGSDQVSQKPAVNGNGECGYRESRRDKLNSMYGSKQEELDKVHKFKALPLNKKIFSSKGDLGVFRNIKKAVTVPEEFNFNMAKKVQHDPPIELFNKLSLSSGLQPNGGLKMKLPPPTSVFVKGSKENTSVSLQQEREIKNLVKERQVRSKAKQMECVKNLPSTGMTRSLGIR